MTPLYIFDLDGTLALTEHRQHLISGPKKDWRGFFAACVNDLPNTPVVNTFDELDECCECVIWSGRSAEVRPQTIEWLGRQFVYTLDYIDSILKMREAGDFTPDHILKENWLKAMSRKDRARLRAVFDDRDTVVEMWRRNGVACFQVAKGDF